MTRKFCLAAIIYLFSLAAHPVLGQTTGQPSQPPAAKPGQTPSDQGRNLIGPNTPIGQPEPPSSPQPTPAPAEPAAPAPAPLILDTDNDAVGIAQQAAHNKGLQARIIWIDAGANVGSLSSPEKIKAIVDQIKAAGFNMIVVDVKPIVGDTIYPSKYAPKLTAWRNATAPADLDVLRHVLDDGHEAGLTVYANMSTFGEGHKLVSRGLGYDHTDWQDVMYLSSRSVSNLGSSIPISTIDNRPADDKSLAAIVTKQSLLAKTLEGYTVAVLNLDARVEALYDGSTLTASPVELPPLGFALIGKGQAGQWLLSHAIIGDIMRLAADPKYVPIAQDNSGAQVYTIFVNPNDPRVRQHELDIVKEVVTNYNVDGMVFDDRLRYAGINADFSQSTRDAFEKFVGAKLTWPDDVLHDSVFPGQDRVLGPYYDQWRVWRAGVIKSWVQEASTAIRQIRPSAQVAVYVGSWYREYDKNGSNWAAPDFQAPYGWTPPDYAQTGYANILDWITTGCYYRYATIDDARQAKAADPKVSLGASVEAAGQLSNRVVNDAAWTYAGIYALDYQKNLDGFKRAIAAAAGSTQGVMIFDISQVIAYNWWNDIAVAFGTSPVPTPPNTVPNLLDSVREQHAADVAAGKHQPDIPAYQGVEDTGL